MSQITSQLQKQINYYCSKLSHCLLIVDRLIQRYKNGRCVNLNTHLCCSNTTEKLVLSTHLCYSSVAEKLVSNKYLFILFQSNEESLGCLIFMQVLKIRCMLLINMIYLEFFYCNIAQHRLRMPFSM